MHDGVNRPAVDVTTPTFRVFSTASLAALGQPRYLVEPFVVDGFTLLWGPSGSGKTFLVLSWALSVATGAPWLGNPVAQGRVVYVSPEGRFGLSQRVAAWMSATGTTVEPHMSWVLQSVDLLSHRAADEFIAAIEESGPPPTLLIIDPLAPSLGGGDESATKDMAAAIVTLQRLRDRFGCALLIVHHAGWDARHERGSTALRAAADTVIEMSGSYRSIRLTCNMSRDAEPFAPTRLALVPERDSLTVATSPESEPSDPPDVLSTLRATFGEIGGFTQNEAIAATGLSQSAVARHLAHLEASSDVTRDKTQRPHVYRIATQVEP